MLLTPDPLEPHGIAHFAERLRTGSETMESVTRAYLQRIEALDGTLHAYAHVDRDGALQSARALDALLQSGTDLGPLMGVPVAIKDNIYVQGMPCRAGSSTDVAARLNYEGPFVARLRQLGCIILGKLHTVEFALGNTGVNLTAETPRNPWDGARFRLPSGSSSGAGVAMSAGLCGLAIGTDTGGSVRGPAAYCGVFGLKLSAGAWSMEGVLPVSRTLDSLGLVARSAADAALAWATIHHAPPVAAREPSQIRLGKETEYFYENLDSEVNAAMEWAIESLVGLHTAVIPISIPGIEQTTDIYNTISKTELAAYLGQSWIEENAQLINSDVLERLRGESSYSKAHYVHCMWRQQALSARVANDMGGVDAWIAPSKRNVAPEYFAGQAGEEYLRNLTVYCTGPTRPANVYTLCASTQPINWPDAHLPIGLQLLARSERELLAVALTMENVFGRPKAPVLTPFITF